MARLATAAGLMFGAVLAMAGTELVAAEPKQPAPAETSNPVEGAIGGRGEKAASSHADDAAKRRMEPRNPRGHGGPIKAVASSPDGKLVATGSFDYSAIIWDITGHAPRLLLRLDDHGGAVNAVAFVPDHGGSGSKELLTATDDGVVSLWEIGTGRLQHRFEGHTGKLTGLAVSPDGRFAVSAGWDRVARVWDLGRRAEVAVLDGHKGPVNAVAFSGDGTTVYTASYDGTIGVFDRNGGGMRSVLVRVGWGINVLRRIEGGEQLVYGSVQGDVGIVDADRRGEPRELKSHQRPVLALAVTEKPGLIATGGGDGVVRVLRQNDGAVVEEFKNPFGPIWAMAFVNQGSAMYLGGLDDFASYWQVAPRAPFEPAEGEFPRRFQERARANGEMSHYETGRLQFARKCSICHTLTPDGANRAGPTLYKIFGRQIATQPGYTFSEPLKRLDIVWTEETVGKLFELGPDVLTPGAKMPLQKIDEKELRDALIAYMKVESEMPSVPGAEGDKR